MVSHLLESIPPEAVYLIVGLMIMIESLGIPVPGEIALVTAAVLATQHQLAVAPEWIAVSGSAGAIVGDSIGFYIGYRVGKSLFDWLGRKFPRHFGPAHVAVAERFFTRHGAWAVFFGRFIALLRIFSGPLAGSLHMPYGRFLLANASGGIIWASGLTYLIWYLGQAAEKWLSRASWIGLAAALLVGLVVTLLIRRRTSKLVSQQEADASTGAGEAPSPATEDEAPRPAREDEASRQATDEETRPAAKTDEETRPAANDEQARLAASNGGYSPNGAARLPAGNGEAGPPAQQRTEPDRQQGSLSLTWRTPHAGLPLRFREISGGSPEKAPGRGAAACRADGGATSTQGLRTGRDGTKPCADDSACRRA